MFTETPLVIYRAYQFKHRFRGLLGRRELGIAEALHLSPCSAVHSFGMTYSLDIVFLDEARKVLDVALLNPNRWKHYAGAASVIELKAGASYLNGLVVGLKIDLTSSRDIGDRHEV